MSPRTTTILAILIVLISSRHAAAQACPLGWAKGPLQEDIRGADGPVHAILEYDPPGSAPPLLMVGGDFQHIGSVAASNIAAWDGNVWKPLGVGTDAPVFALTVFNGNLIAGGVFNEAGGVPSNLVAAWNGNGWFTFGNGLIAKGPNKVLSLATFNGDLFAGGDFYIPGFDDEETGIARLVGGTVWAPLFSVGVDPKDVTGMQAFDDDGAGPHLPALYVSGDGGAVLLSNIFKWVGGQWTTIIDYDFVNDVNAFTVTSQGLITGGAFVGVQGGNTKHVAAWNGTGWSGLGNDNWTASNGDAEVFALRMYGNDLYAAGGFNVAGGVPCVNMARWNGSNWFPTGNFFSGEGYELIGELRVHAGELIAGGKFNLADSLGEVNNLAKFDGQFWKAFTMPVRVNALGTIGSGWLVLGGSFAQTYDNEQLKTLQHIAIWNGLELAPLDSGVNAPVHAIKSYNAGGEDRLIVGGDFTLVGSDPGSDPGIAGSAISANRIALWSQPLLFGGGWEPMGEGFNGKVLAVERIEANQFLGELIFAAGEFTAAADGSPAFNRIAAWYGSPPTWNTVSTGFNGTVRALKGYNSGAINRHLYAAGDFTTVDGISANRIAHYPMPNLNGWVAMGNGFNAPVHAIERHNGSIYAAGEFTMSGSTPISHVARWTGTAWESVGPGINGNIYALKSHDGKLYATGGFAFLVWDGTTWAAVDGALTLGSGRAIQPFRTEIEVGGDFIAAGGGAVDTSGLARFLYQGIPWIVKQPVAQTRNCHFDVATFDVDIPPGYENLVGFQWYKNGQPLTEGWDGTGSYRTGTHSVDLIISDPSDADEGTYHLVISNNCGTVTSSAVSLTVNGTCPPCPMDIAPLYAGNGLVDVDDLLLLVNSWGSCTSAPFQCRADVAPPGGNGIVDVDDLLAMINAWGSCP